MRPRAPRQKVLLPARACIDGLWHDVCVLNACSRGIGLQAARPPAAGTYLEVRRGAHIVVGRVVWARGRRFGIRTQDGVTSQFLSQSPSTEIASNAAGNGQHAERRASSRIVTCQHERSRALARAVEFGCVAGVGLIGACLIFSVMEEAVAAPFSVVRHVLDR